MKIVIDIPDKIYNTFHKGNWSVTYDGKKIRDIVMRGTPLDKIRAEIMEDIDKVQKDLIEEIDQGIDIGLQMALDTVNKYKAESEDKE